MVTKIIIALLLFSQGTMIEHTVTAGIKDCLEKKRIMKRNMADTVQISWSKGIWSACLTKSASNKVALVSILFNLSITPKYAHTPTAVAPSMLRRFLIGILIEVLSDIFIIYILSN